MKFISLVLFVALFACALGAPRRFIPRIPLESLLNGDERIVGGTEVSPHSLPFIVAIERRSSASSNWVFGCGGAILSYNKILTTAFSLYGINSTANIKVLAGLHDRKNPDGFVQLGDVFSLTNHPNFSDVTYENDIAIIKLNSPGFNLNPYVNIADLPPRGDDQPNGTVLTVAGWGVIETVNGTDSEVLRSVNVQKVDSGFCRAAYQGIQNVNTATMLCAGAIGGKDSCTGDAGQPLFISTGARTAVVHGLASWGAACGDETKPGVYTKVSAFVDWILLN